MKKYKIITNSRFFLFSIFIVMLSGCAAPPEQPDVFLIQKQAAKAYQTKNWKLAEEKYSYLLSLSPNVVEVWFRLGNIYAHTQKPEKAIMAYREAVVRQPTYDKAWHNFGLMSLRKTTALYLEMLKNMEESSPLYQQAKQTADALIKILEQRRKNNRAAATNNSVQNRPKGELSPVKPLVVNKPSTGNKE